MVFGLWRVDSRFLHPTFLNNLKRTTCVKWLRYLPCVPLSPPVTPGLPMKNMKTYLDLPTDKQDAVLKNEGIPCDSLDNQFKSWVRNARAVNSDLRIAIKADADTPYSVIKNVMNSLQDLRENRYNLITSLKTTSEN